MDTGKLNLAALHHVVQKQKGKTGTFECLVIPIEKNNLFKSDKTGAVYLDLIAFGLKEPKDYQTHLVKQSLPKEVREAMSDEEKKAQPIIGNLNMKGEGGFTEANNNAANEVLDAGDDLPF